MNTFLFNQKPPSELPSVPPPEFPEEPYPLQEPPGDVPPPIKD